MSDLALTEELLGKIGGWEAVKKARGYVETGQVLSSNWTPPVLKGVVQAGGTSYRAGLVIRSATDVENVCTCRDSREWGTICAHSLGVGLHHIRRERLARGETIKPQNPGLAVQPPRSSAPAAAPQKKVYQGLMLVGERDSGTPLRLHVIFPPNWAGGLAKGRITIHFEGESEGRRAPLSSMSRGTRYFADAGDEALLRYIDQFSEGEVPSLVTLSPAELSDFLMLLAGHPRVTLGRQQKLEVIGNPWRPPIRAQLESNGEIRIKLGSMPPQAQLVTGTSRSWLVGSTQLQLLALSNAMQKASGGEIRLKRSEVPMFLSRDWAAWQKEGEIEANFKLEDFVCETAAPKFLLSLAGGLAQLMGQLQCRYGQRIFTVGQASSDDGFWIPDPNDPKRYLMRDAAAEQVALSRLLKCGFSRPDGLGNITVLGEDRVLTFFSREYPKLEKEWQVTLEERLQRSTEKNMERVEPEFKVLASGERWFDLEVNFATSSGESFSAADIQRLLLSGRSHTRLKNGKFALIDTGAVEELQQVLVDCSPEQRDGRYRMDQRQAGFLQSSLQESGFTKVQAPEKWRQNATSGQGVASMPVPPLGSLETVLRPYQRQGVAWLWFLRSNRFGGVLADEMGLGKTLQTLALLAAAHAATDAKDRQPSLIVCPTTLVFNWQAEAKRFTPQLKVLVLDGPQRTTLFGSIPEYDLVITSYALIRRDVDQYRAVEFDTVVLDEAQHIKNRESQNAQAVKAVRSEHRLVLTGTPMENSVLDLWSIFDFLMPGYLAAAKDFRERYEVPIVRDKDADAQRRLSRRLRPFLLRRLKKDVAKDLPDKIDQVSYCDLTSEQQAAYAGILEASRKQVMEAVGSQGLAKSRMMIFTALLRLRQVCCDLRLLKLPGPQPALSSGKLELFEELLEEVIDGGHRALVFSQFVEMLTLLREKLDADGVKYCYLDGSTTDRGAVVQRFQNSNDVPLFLISLKAGGTGLNLTGADTVIHFDPWWNPAVEDQATGRAHRIGQQRVVTSYKLIARGTLEEKMLRLQERKREMAEATLSGDEAIAASLSWEEIQDLLAG
ncbi:MAG TPA: SNF2-related protein [Roseimicrobium sp.]|nr:SNF2-related protein [Roseimicrobium sp.]